MDGRIFLYSKVTPPPATCSAPAFTFDLQRFAIDDTATGALFSYTKDSQTKYGHEASDFSTDNLNGAKDIQILGNITLTANVEVNLGTTITDVIKIAGDNVTLDLADKNLTVKREGTGTVSGIAWTDSKSASAIVVQDGKTFTVNGTTGKIDYDWDPSSSNNLDTIKKARHSAAVQVGQKVGKYDDDRSSTSKATFNMEGGTITSKSTAISMSDNAVVNIKDGTTESTKSCGIYYGNNSPGGGTINISGGTLKSGESSQLPAIQISGNIADGSSSHGGKDSPAKINITGGTIAFTNNGYNTEDSGYFGNDGKPVGNPDAIYAGGNTELKISGGTIKSTGTGVELRAGSLNFTGGTVESTATSYKVKEASSTSNTNGGQTFGAAITVVQHTTDKSIDVDISGTAQATGAVALSVENTADRKGDAELTVDVTGGTFTSNDTTASAIALSNGDSRVKVNVKDATFVGSLVTKSESTGTGTSTEQAQIHVSGTITVVNPETKEATTYDDKSLTFTEPGKTTGFVVEPDTWVQARAEGVKNTFYFVQRTAETGGGSSVAVARAFLLPVVTESEGATTTSTSDLNFSLLSGLALDQLDNILELDLSGDTFGDLSSTFINLSVNDETSPNAHNVNITGNDYLKKIIGGAGNDILTAGSAGTSLNGGAGNDLLNGGDGADTFIFTAGVDSITGYKHGTDIVSLAADSLTAPIDFTNATFDGNNLVLNFDTNSLTFQSVSQASLKKSTATYSYKANSGGMEYIAQEGEGISLGAGYTSNFNGTIAANENYTTINAANINKAIQIRGNDKANYMVGGSIGGALLGGDNDDMIIAGGGSTTLRGELGNDVLKGFNGGKDTFYYSEGTDSIGGYSASDGDLIISSFNLTEATVSKGTGTNMDLILTFGSEALSIAGGAEATDRNAISIQSGNNIYTFTKDYVAHNKGITLASDYSGTFNGADYSNYATINAAEVGSAISIVGNDNNNYIVGSKNGGSLSGGAGNDKLDVLDRGENAKYLFQYTAGKDEVNGFDAESDLLQIDTSKITEARANNGKLKFTFDKNNSIDLKSEDDIEKVSLTSGGYLTKDGYVNGTSFNLFSNARGIIELNAELYNGITSVNAESVKDQSITLTGGTQGGKFYYAAGNKQRDGFEYGGGNVTISGYEGGRDKIDLGAASLAGFEVEEDNGVVLKLNLGGSSSISIASAKGEEILLHDANNGRTYQKMVFVADGVVENKKKNPTAATVSASYNFADTSSAVKKIYVKGNTEAVSIQAGDKNNTIIDASKAGAAVSLSGGKKNDKLTGSSTYNDVFIYGEGKDIINGYGKGDSISLASDLEDSLDSAKITAGSKSIKFKFSNKNVLTVKGADSLGALNINGTERTYVKNAIADSSGKNVSLTSAFSGTFKTSGTKGLDEAVTYVDGEKVTKNLTFVGSDANETLIGGGKKNMFKGGGGADSLVGGDGAKDTFFYAKSDTGNATIAKFEYGKDKLKVASGKISGIANNNGEVTFSMADGGAVIGSFKVENNNLDNKKVAIRANNTYYWFADEKATDDSYEKGALITSDKRITAGEVSGFAVIDLNYSTNLAKTNVAFKVTGATPNKTTTT